MNPIKYLLIKEDNKDLWGDLTYVLRVVSQYMHNPGEQHMNPVIHILRYLKSALGKGILFTKNIDHQSIELYTDAD